MSLLAAALFNLTAAPARSAGPTPAQVEACAKAYSPADKAKWGTSAETWRAICAEGDEPDRIRAKGAALFLQVCRKRVEGYIRRGTLPVERVRRLCADGKPGYTVLLNEILYGRSDAEVPDARAGSSSLILYRLVRELGATVTGAGLEHVRFVRPDGRYRATQLGDHIVLSETTPADCFIDIRSRKSSAASARGVTLPSRLYDRGCTGRLETISMEWDGRKPPENFLQRDMNLVFDIALDVFQFGY